MMLLRHSTTHPSQTILAAAMDRCLMASNLRQRPLATSLRRLKVGAAKSGYGSAEPARSTGIGPGRL